MSPQKPNELCLCLLQKLSVHRAFLLKFLALRPYHDLCPCALHSVDCAGQSSPGLTHAAWTFNVLENAIVVCFDDGYVCFPTTGENHIEIHEQKVKGILDGIIFEFDDSKLVPGFEDVCIV